MHLTLASIVILLVLLGHLIFAVDTNKSYKPINLILCGNLFLD